MAMAPYFLLLKFAKYHSDLNMSITWWQ